MEKSINAEIQELQLKLENAENYNHYLSDLYDNVRGFKHDFDNIINCIGGYIKSDDMDGLSAAYDLFGKSGAAVYQAVKNGQISFTDFADTTDILNESLGATSDTYEATLDPIDEFKIALKFLLNF